uniref:Uncharacterized protein n=1 Tax=Ixodes ricinus TaxID=34613 RepID=A0A6B0UCR0_IXORI
MTVGKPERLPYALLPLLHRIGIVILFCTLLARCSFSARMPRMAQNTVDVGLTICSVWDATRMEECCQWKNEIKTKSSC